MRWVVGCVVLGLIAGLSNGAVITLGAAADAFVTPGPANELAGFNYGDASSLMVAGSGGGLGVFKTVVRFNTSNVKASFDAQLGAGAWGITSITVRHGSNAGAAGIQPNNLMFPVIRAGDFDVSWMADDSWQEGIGFPLKPTTTGITNNTLDSFLSAADRPLGRFRWDAPGNNIRRTWSLALDPALLADVAGGPGSLTSFLYTPADNDVAFLFNARSYSNSTNRPLLTITAEVPEPGLSLPLIGAAWALLRPRPRSRR